MPFMPDPQSPSPPLPPPPPPSSVKWSRVRELRASLKPSRRGVPAPLPSPSVYDDDYEEEGQQLGATMTTVVGTAAKARIVDVERGGAAEEDGGAAKRKTLLQRALEGWWDLPGLLSRGDTVREKKTRPVAPTRKERSLAEAGFV